MPPTPPSSQPQDNQDKGFFARLFENFGKILEAIGNLFAGLFSSGKPKDDEEARGAYAMHSRSADENQAAARQRARESMRSEVPVKPLQVENLNTAENRTNAIKTLARMDEWIKQSEQVERNVEQKRDSYLAAWSGDGDSRVSQDSRRAMAVERANELSKARAATPSVTAPSFDELFDAKIAMSLKSNGAIVENPGKTAAQIFQQNSDGDIAIRTDGGKYRLEKLPKSGEQQQYRITVYDELPDVRNLISAEPVRVKFEPQSMIVSADQLARIKTDNPGLEKAIFAQVDPDGSRIAQEQENARKNAADAAKREANKQRYRQQQRDEAAWNKERLEMMNERRDNFNQSRENKPVPQSSRRSPAADAMPSPRYISSNVGAGDDISSGVGFRKPMGDTSHSITT